MEVTDRHPVTTTPSEVAPRGRGWLWARVGILVGALALLAAMVLLGSFGSSYARLENDLRHGRVDAVRVAHPRPADATGSGLVTLTWETRWGTRHTEVRQIRGLPADSGAAEDLPEHRGDLVAHLRSLHPGPLAVSVTRPRDHGEIEAFGWRGPVPVAFLPLLLVVAAIAVVAQGPQPWRATRWAWFWVLWSPVGLVALLAFAVLAGPVPGLPAARPGHRRLTGGWAFLLTLLIGGAVTG